jgi:crotonobetainyl-CoA:carnitine CoA-transferase CaiB-like acyl-CoA transferase
VYACADGKYVSVAPIETRFFEDLLQRLDIAPADFPDRWDRTQWPRLRSTLAARFRTRTRDAWCELLEGTDACFAPVLTMAEAPVHAHAAARGAFTEVGGVQQPMPAPRFSRSVPDLPKAPATSSREQALATLRGWLGHDRFNHLENAGQLQAVQGSTGA